MTIAGLLKMVDFAIDSTQVDLNALRDGDWLTLKERLYDFFTEEIEWALAPRTRPLTNDQIIMLGSIIGMATPTDDSDYIMSADCVAPILALGGKDRDSAEWQ